MNIRKIVLALAVLVPTTVCAKADDVTLRRTFRQDREYHYVLNHEIQMSTTSPLAMYNNQKWHRSQTCALTWKVKSIKADGSAEITETVDRIRIKVGDNGGGFELDSSQAPNPAHAGAVTLHEAIDAMVGTPIDVVMSPRGELISVKLPYHIRNAMMGALPFSHQVGVALSEPGLKRIVEMSSMLILPDKPVSAGSIWAHTRLGEDCDYAILDVDTAYTDKGETRDKFGLRRVDGAVTLRLRWHDTPAASARITSQDNTATFLFDVVSGHLCRSQVKRNVRLENISNGRNVSTVDVTETISLNDSECAPPK
jgi:Family of unknown function (DUF6263)